MTANGNTVPEEGTLLWARPDGEGGAGGIEPLRAAVREFKLAVHCCGYAELPELIKTSLAKARDDDDVVCRPGQQQRLRAVGQSRRIDDQDVSFAE